MLNGLDLFSGIGGITLALEPWVRPVAYCENDRYAQSVLLSRMRDGGLPTAPIWSDVRTLSGHDLPQVDIICGGFPCQDISAAGRGAGLSGERSRLFFEVSRLAQEVEPAFIFLENVPAIRTRGLEVVIRELADLGFICRWRPLSAAQVGAPHKRERWFCVAAHPQRLQLRIESGGGSRSEGEGQAFIGIDGTEQSVVDANRPAGSVTRSSGETVSRPQAVKRPGRCGGGDSPKGDVSDAQGVGGLQGRFSLGKAQEITLTHSDGERAPGILSWSVEPDVGRVANGVPAELDFFIFESEELDGTGIESNFEKEVTEARLFNREVLRKMWEHKEIATTSPELYFRRLHDSLPTLPRRPAQIRGNLGQRIKEGSELYNLWNRFHSASEKAEQVMWQSKLLKRIWEIKCDETMAKANRLDRLKGLGNAVVPLQARAAFKILMGLGE